MLYSRVLPYIVLSCLVLSDIDSYCIIFPCLAGIFHILAFIVLRAFSYIALSCRVSSYLNCIALYCIRSYCVVLSYLVLFVIVVSFLVLLFVLYCLVLSYVGLVCLVVSCILLNCLDLSCIVFFSIALTCLV